MSIAFDLTLLFNGERLECKWIPSYPQYVITINCRIFRYNGRWYEVFCNLNISSGYLTISLSYFDNDDWYAYKTLQAHQLMMLTFVGKPPCGQEVRHLDGAKLNNNLSNLRYGTRSENMQDKVRHGTDNKGERHGNAKLTEKFIQEIFDLYWNKSYKQWEIAEELGISIATVSMVLARKRWPHVKIG